MRLPLFIIFLCIFYSTNSASAPVTVVELFTSQGCYSCPPADAILGKLKKSPDTIVLACHVTYWNYLGWKDTFSHSFCDTRQRDYQAYLQGRAGVYTPQIIINGQYATVGSRQTSVTRLIKKAKQEHKLATIVINTPESDKLSIELPALETPQIQQLLLLGTSGNHRLAIKQGENGGKTLDYHNPVEDLIELGNWSGEARTLLKTISNQPTVREWIVIAQSKPSGKIVAAGKFTL